MRIVIIGASGMIGSAVFHAAKTLGHQVVGTYAARPRDWLLRFDTTKDKLLELVPDLGPGDCVMLMAAAVDQAWVRAHAWESHRVNFIGPVAVAEDAMSRGAHLVFMSSEAVFDVAEKCDSFAEDAAPRPGGLYALQKMKVEACLPMSKACIVRTGSVVGWGAGDRRCAVSNTYASLLRPGAKMARDNVLTVTDVDDLVDGLMRVASERAVGILHLAGGAVTRTQLADWIIGMSRRGPEMAYEPTSAAALGAPMTLAGLVSKRWDLHLQLPRDVVEAKVAMLDEVEVC